jgi:SAM-dependent methyltransferase
MAAEILSDQKTAETSVPAPSEHLTPLACPVCNGSDVVFLFSAPDRFHLRTVPYDLLRCQSCTLVWQKNPPALPEIGQHYGPDYHRSITAAADSSKLRWSLQDNTIARYKVGGRLLDLGCSAGAFLSTMKGDAWTLSGIEISPEEAQHARERACADVFVGDIFDAPFEPSSFDVITSFDVLEHLYHPKRVIRHVYSWLKPGGIYYVAVPNIESWESRLFKSYWYGLEMPRHLFMYSPTSLRKLATDAGFSELLCSTPPASYAENSIYYLWGEFLQRISRMPTPLSQAKGPGPLGSLFRKGLRFTLRNPYRTAASWAGAGPALEMVFQKPESAG